MRSPAIRILLLLILPAVLLTLLAPPALAHDSLKSSSPAKGSVVTGLDQIELEFSAHVSFPVVILHDAAGRRFESGSPRTDGPKVFENVAGPLPPGSYVIAWRIVSSDGHPVEGEIPFTVASPGSDGAAQPSAAGTTGAAPKPSAKSIPATTASTSGIPVWVWGLLGLLAIVGTAAVIGMRKTPQDAPQPGAEPERN
ncbi:copper resistance CopC family protein [Sphaerisporangium perillae]|uniref:copper resistance CopC family protein n=1 Tax=Sphaerisporangium perillae TaxID=2935860 RepID=UPI00200C9AFE|nr:copper resistance CopC family protein [Sphaerisporangium perillae]